MINVPQKKEFTQVYKDLQKVVDIDDSRGRSVPINMNFTEEGYLTKDKGAAFYGVSGETLTHSDFNYIKKNGDTYHIRARGQFLQRYIADEWVNISSGEVTMTIADPAVITQVGHGLKENSKIVFATDGELPTGITPGTTYYVIATGLTDDAFQISDEEGGTAIETTGTQSGTHTIYRVFTEGKEFGWYVYDDKLYGGNAYEFFFSFDGTKFTDFHLAPKGNVIEVYEDRMFLSGRRDEPLSIYYSATGDPEDWTDTAKVFQPLGTDKVMTMKNYYGVLMVFKRESIWKISFVYEQTLALFVLKFEQQSGTYGAAGRKAVSWVENDLWFYTGTEVRAIGFTDQQTGVFGINKSVISENIKETIALIPEQFKHLVTTFYHARRFYFAVPLGAGEANDTLFVCHLLYGNNWTKYTGRDKASSIGFLEIDNVVYSSKAVAPFGTMRWNEQALSDNGEAIHSEVFFRRNENEDFNTYNTYRYLDLIFKDLDATVTVTVRKDAADNRLTSTKQFYVGSVLEGMENSLGEVDPGQYWVADSFGEQVGSTPFLRRRVSFLMKAQSLTIGLSNSAVGEDFTVAAYSLSGFAQPRRFFPGSRITSM